MRETWDDVGGVRKAGTIPRRVVLSCETEGASDKAFVNNITFLNGRPCNRANKTNRYKVRLELLRSHPSPHASTFPSIDHTPPRCSPRLDNPLPIPILIIHGQPVSKRSQTVLLQSKTTPGRSRPTKDPTKNKPREDQQHDQNPSLLHLTR